MKTTPRMTFEEFQQLPENEVTSYELDEGTLLIKPSPTLCHNLIRQRIAMELGEFARSRHLGITLENMDFRLGPDTVRNPDIAFVTSEHLKKIDMDRSPADGAPALVIEVISPADLEEDLVKRTHQYLNAGCKAVWIIYPSLRLAKVYDSTSIRMESQSLQDAVLLPGFSLALADSLDYYKEYFESD